VPAAGDLDDDWDATVADHKRRRMLRIGRAAADLVARDGLAAVTMSALARAAGVSRATLYNYVPDVPTAIESYLAIQASAFHTAVAAAVAAEAGPEARLRRYIREQVAYAAGADHRAVSALSHAGAVLQGAGSASAHRHRQADVLDGILEQGVREGVFRAAPVEVQALLVSRLLYCADELLHRQRLSEDETVDAIAGMVFDGVRASASGP